MPLFRFWCAVDGSQNTVWTADLMIRGGSCFMRVTRSCSGAVVAEPSGRRFRSLAALPILCQGLLCQADRCWLRVGFSPGVRTTPTSTLKPRLRSGLFLSVRWIDRAAWSCIAAPTALPLQRAATARNEPGLVAPPCQAEETDHRPRRQQAGLPTSISRRSRYRTRATLAREAEEEWNKARPRRGPFDMDQKALALRSPKAL